MLGNKRHLKSWWVTYIRIFLSHTEFNTEAANWAAEHDENREREQRKWERSLLAHKAAAAPLSSVQTENTQEQLKDAADVKFLKLGENTVQFKNTDEQ